MPFIDASKVTSFDVAKAEWERHADHCESESCVCGCKFYFKCTQCGADLMSYGESMPYQNGQCDACRTGVRTYWP
jgi:hypothetical protein